MQRLIDLTGGLSQSQTRLLLSTNNLTDAQKLAVLVNRNLAQGMNRDVAEATAQVTPSTSSPYGTGNPYQSVEDHAQKTNKATTQQTFYRIIDNQTGEVVKNSLSKYEAEDWLNKNNVGGRYTIQAYAKGGIVSKDDDGVLNSVAKAVGEDTMVAVKYGESILTPVQTEMIQKFAQALENPEFQQNFNIPWNMPNYTVQNTVPQIERVDRPNVTVHIDKLNEFNGDFNNIDQIDSRMMKIATKSATKLLDGINRDFKARH